jgi:hypothetical protein
VALVSDQPRAVADFLDGLVELVTKLAHLSTHTYQYEERGLRGGGGGEETWV